MIRKTFILFITSLATASAYHASASQHVIIIIHGTWAHKKKHAHWYNPNGYFFDTIEKNVSENTSVISFLWSGDNTAHARDTGGLVLAKLINSYSADTTITIIAHSHGATVGIIASHYLAKDPKNHKKIRHFYSLGRPVDNTLHLPNMDTIEYFYNFFSYNDAIQPVFGAYEREIHPQHERIANIRMVIDGRSPDHSELHDPCVAEWIHDIHTFLTNYETFSFFEPGLIHFFSDGPPEYFIDTERAILRFQDQQANNKINHAIKTGSYKIKRSIKDHFEKQAKSFSDT